MRLYQQENIKSLLYNYKRPDLDEKRMGIQHIMYMGLDSWLEKTLYVSHQYICKQQFFLISNLQKNLHSRSSDKDQDKLLEPLKLAVAN